MLALRSFCAAQREFRLQLANALQNADKFTGSEFGIVTRKLDRFFRLRNRRLNITRAVTARRLVRKEFGNQLDSPAGKHVDLRTVAFYNAAASKD